MVGRDISDTEYKVNTLQGEVSLTFDLDQANMDIDFTKIYDLNRGTSRDDMTWRDVDVANGDFKAPDGTIQGRFLWYGT